jgi:pilus assembly protein CpaB
MKRLTPAAVTMMIFLVVGMLVTAYFAKRLLAEERPQTAVSTPAVNPATIIAPKSPAREFQEIPVAICALQPGTELKAEYLGSRRIWIETLEPDTLFEERNLIGRIVKQRIAASAPIRASQLYEPGEQPALVVERNMRAVSVALSPASARLAGFARVGQCVDVHFTPRANHLTAGRPRALTVTLLRGVRVLAVTGDGSKPSSPQLVTLQVTPEQANALILARNKGEIALSYNPDCQATTATNTNEDRATLENILGQQPAQTRFTSESYKGSARTTLSFQGSNQAQSP